MRRIACLIALSAALVSVPLTAAAAAPGHSPTRAQKRLIRAIPETASSPGCSSYAPQSPVLHGSHLFVISGGAIKEYHAISGRLIRSIDLGGADFINYRYLALGHGEIIVGGTGCDSQSDPNGYVTAYDAATGAHRWDWTGSGIGDMVENGGYLVVSGGTFASGDYLDVLNVSDGSTVWSITPDCLLEPTPVADGNVIVSSCHLDGQGDDVADLSAFSVTTGAPAWIRDGDFQVDGADSATGPTPQVYAAQGNSRRRDLVIDAATGTTTARLPKATDVLAADSGRVYATCGSAGRHLCAYTKATGTLAWRASYTAGDAAPLASLSGGVVYLNDGSARNSVTGHLISREWSGTATGLAAARGLVAVDFGGPRTNIYGLLG